MREILYAVLSTETNPLLLVGSVQVGAEQTVVADCSTPAFLSICREPSCFLLVLMSCTTNPSIMLTRTNLLSCARNPL